MHPCAVVPVRRRAVRRHAERFTGCRASACLTRRAGCRRSAAVMGRRRVAVHRDRALTDEDAVAAGTPPSVTYVVEARAPDPEIDGRLSIRASCCGQLEPVALPSADAGRVPGRSDVERDFAAAQPPLNADELQQLGIGRGALQGPSWRQVARGLHTPAIEQVTVAQRIVDAAAQLPMGAAIGGWAAAYVGGVDQLDGTDPRTGKEEPVDCVGGLKRRSTGRIRYRRSELAVGEVTEQYAIPVTTAVRTALDG